MSFLSALPKELLLEIISYLPPLSVEALAETFSYNITPTCLPSLTSLIARRRHIKAMIAQFGPFSFRLNRNFAHALETAAKLSLTSEEQRCMRNPEQREIPYRLEHLDWVFESDQLAWLARMPRSDLQHPHLTGQPMITAFTHSQMSEIEAAMGFALPSAYTTLFTTQDLLDRIRPVVANYLNLPGGFRKIEMEGTQGCLINIYNDHLLEYDVEYAPVWSMYVSPNGSNCVLSAKAGRDDEGDCEVRFQGVGFAEWLAMMCFRQNARSARKYNKEVSVDLEDYWRAMYVTGNRAREGQGTREEPIFI
jgi:hypothetical protein